MRRHGGDMADALERIGCACYVRTREGWWTDATVKDVRFAYGRRDYLVVPLVAGPELWVSEDRISFTRPED